MKRSESIANLAAALAKVQGAMKPAVKDSTNPHFKSKYADLAAVWAACQAHLAENQVALLQESMTTPDGSTAIVTLLAHSSGEWIEAGPLVVPTDKMNAQGVGSALKYGRRYALESILSIPAEDDDGNAAVKAQEDARAREQADALKITADKQKQYRAEFAAVVKQAADLGICNKPTTQDQTAALLTELLGVVPDMGQLSWDDFRAATQELKDRIKITEAERARK